MKSRILRSQSLSKFIFTLLHLHKHVCRVANSKTSRNDFHGSIKYLIELEK